MAQEVQTALDYRVELNEIEGIGYQQRKVSDKMQVRDKTSNQVTAIGATNLNVGMGEVIIGSWTATSSGGVDYVVKGGDIYIPTSGAYMFQFIPQWAYTQTSYYYTFRVKADGKTLYSERTTLSDWQTKSATINVGRGNKITVTLEAEWSASAYLTFTIKLIKL